MSSNFNSLLSFEYSSLTDISKIKDISKNYRKKENISNSEIIDVILAVDAISFNPNVKIDSKGFVKGLIQDEKISDSDLIKFERNFSAFEEFVKKNKYSIITNAFVYQAQPISPNYHSFVVHMSPSSQGKGTDREVSLLINISHKLQKENYRIISYAFDGDSIYRKLHSDLYNQYSFKIRNDCTFLNFSELSLDLVISDPLHLLKRARYRLVSSNVHIGLTKNSKIIDIEKLKEIFQYPNIIYSNLVITKMHDSLATQLFSFYSLKELIESGNSEYLVYFLPLCFLNIAISEKKLYSIERINLLEIAFYYSLILKEESNTTGKILPQKKYKNKNDIRLFDDVFLLELTNTLFSYLSIFYCKNGLINLNRLSSNPLEHTFGLIRMRSKYSHIYENAIKSMGKIELYRKISQIIKPGEPINGRKSYFGQLMHNNITKFENVFNIDPRDLAVCLHLFLNLPITYHEIQSSDMNDLLLVTNEVIETFELNILSIYYRCYPNERKIKLSTNEITKIKSNILNRFKNQNEFMHQL